MSFTFHQQINLTSSVKTRAFLCGYFFGHQDGMFFDFFAMGVGVFIVVFSQANRFEVKFLIQINRRLITFPDFQPHVLGMIDAADQ